MNDCCLPPKEPFFSYIMTRTTYIRWDDNDVRFVLNQHAWLYSFSTSSLKQQSAGRHVASRRHADSEPTSLSPQWCVLSGESPNINVMVFGLTQPRYEPTIYYTRIDHVHRYTFDAVQFCRHSVKLISPITLYNIAIDSTITKYIQEGPLNKA